jgi:hypothetical protein
MRKNSLTFTAQHKINQYKGYQFFIDMTINVKNSNVVDMLSNCPTLRSTERRGVIHLTNIY